MRVEGQLQPSSDFDLWTLLAKVALKYLRDAGNSTSSTEEGKVDEGDELAARLREALTGIGDGLYMTRNEEEDLWEAYVVANDHTDAVYEAVVAAEEKLLDSIRGVNLAVRVRAHQGHAMELVVPQNARRILPS